MVGIGKRKAGIAEVNKGRVGTGLPEKIYMAGRDLRQFGTSEMAGTEIHFCKQIHILVNNYSKVTVTLKRLL